MTAATTTARPTATSLRRVTPMRRRRLTARRVLLHAVLITTALAWFLPLAWAVFTSLRPYEETARKGYVSWPDQLTLGNYREAFTEGELAQFFLNTIVIVVPALLITLLLSSLAAFVLSRFSFRGNS